MFLYLPKQASLYIFRLKRLNVKGVWKNTSIQIDVTLVLSFCDKNSNILLKKENYNWLFSVKSET